MSPSNLKTFFESPRLTLYRGDSESVLELLPEASVDCIVTSPPYYGQRDYGVRNQIGLEKLIGWSRCSGQQSAY